MTVTPNLKLRIGDVIIQTVQRRISLGIRHFRHDPVHQVAIGGNFGQIVGTLKELDELGENFLLVEIARDAGRGLFLFGKKRFYRRPHALQKAQNGRNPGVILL